MASARSCCPECDSNEVVDLTGILYSPRVDFFRCGDCLGSWMIPKNTDEPVTRMVLGKAQQADCDEKAG